MKTVQVFDRAMCCPTGICGPQVDPVLPVFAADLEWIQSRGISVQRFNLAQQPAAFVDNPVVRELLTTRGVDCLPLILVDGNVVSRGEYPSRQRLVMWTGLPDGSGKLAVVQESGGCKETGCC